MEKLVVLFLFLSITLRGQVFFNGKDISKLSDDYLTVTQVIYATPKGATIYYDGVISGDTTGSWVSKAKLSMKQLKGLMIESFEKSQIRDSLGVVIPITLETDLFNIMSKTGFDFLKKDPPMTSELFTTIIKTTIYTFKRKRN